VTDDRFTFSEIDLAAAIRNLRQALGRSPEVMAQILGCSLPAYQKWEAGDLIPSGDWLIRLLQLCPNEETRMAFRIRAERRSAPRERPENASQREGPLSSAERREYREMALHAIEIIYECGDAGIQAADRRLRDFAENLVGAARYYSKLVKNGNP
jgi:transcriptional regulator with XRE-family HTH domain